ncbi:MAG: hypothetical protein DHS20C18_50780 [Saprospiraceae bacterium]|nr:MAG: hypothetical protein DHS20C18_50780 [Saprospiraceae bacterium]
MNKKYRLLILSFICGWTLSNTGFASNGEAHSNPIFHSSLPFLLETPAEVLHLNQQIKLGGYTMQITELEESAGFAATGKGAIYFPFLDEKLAVQFEGIRVNILGELMAGEIVAITAALDQPTFRSSEKEVLQYLKFSNEKGRLPRILNPTLEAEGMDFGDHEMILTKLIFSKENTRYNAMFMVHNPDGRVTTFSRNNLLISEDKMTFCDQAFHLDGGNQSTTDPILPIIIKGYNPAATKGSPEEGTYVSFTCDGLDKFHLSGEYHFDNKKVRLLAPRDGSAPDGQLKDTLVAKFSVDISTWGQFSVAVDFGGAPFNKFEIVGVDDVIFTIDSAMIDYSDTENPFNLPISYFEDSRNNVVYTNNYLDWRGFFIQSVTVQLPQSLSLTANGSRVQFGAENIIYDRPNGLTATFNVLPEQGKNHIAQGHLEGWGVSIDTVRLQVTHNSPEKFDLLGGVQIPVMRESIAYAAKFNYPDNPPSGNTPKVELAFELVIADSSVFTIPFLNDSKMKLANSVAGFRYLGGVFTPYANFSGSFELGFVAGQSGSGIGADFQFPGLGFQGFTLNYDYLNDEVIPQQPNTGGLANMDFYAFEFAGKTFQSGGGGSGDEPDAEDESDDGALVKQKVKGFPIAIKNIGFRSTGVGNDKSLDFTILLNFTKPKVGLTASASLGIVSQIDFGELLTLEPWNAFSFKELKLYQILVGSKEKPVDIGGISLYGGLAVIEKHVTYGDGFKGFLVMKVQPGITVDVVGQFGTISKSNGSLDYRYWFADAKMTIKKGIKLGPAPVGVFGFGGGAYYNMAQMSFAATQFDVSLDSGSQNIPEDGSTPQISSAMLQPGRGLFCSYTPRKDVFGVKAVVVLGTHPKPKTANMDLVLGIEFNTNPFGLRKVSLIGDVYFMADLNKRQRAQVKGTTSIVYNHSAKTLEIDGSVAVKLKDNIITGGGNFNLFFNLNPGKSDDWYVALGAPPISKRMGLKFKLGTTQSIAGYFVAGNINRLPVAKRTLPRLREYHPMLQEFEGQNSLNFGQLMNGNAILMGMSYTYKVDKDYKVIGASVDFTAGFDAMLSECQCAGYIPTGIDGWYLQGQIYGAMEGKLDIRVKLPFHRGRYNIATLKAGALVQAKLPSPTWMSAHVKGSYRILSGLVKGDFKLDLEYGEKCIPVGSNLSPGDLVADIKIIGPILPNSGAADIPVYREKLAVVSFLEPINRVMDFSAESDDGLMVKPYLISLSTIQGGPEPVQGAWRYLNASNSNVGAAGIYNHAEFVSTKLLAPKTKYRFTVQVGWKKKTNKDSDWKVVYKTDGNGNPTNTPYVEKRTVPFTSDDRPVTLPPDAVLASYPDYRAINYGILDNPSGGGVALKLEGWGYLFNPKKRDNKDGACTPENIFEYDYFVRIVDVASGEQVFEGPLKAVPVPEWGQPVGDLVYLFQNPCQSSNPFLSWAYRFFNISCTVASQGPCAVLQPTRNTVKSNVKGMANSWSFGGSENNFDLAISQNTDVYNKSIGFPDFSQALKRGRVYRFDLVGKPIVEEETYTIATTVTENPQVNTGYGTYTVSSTSQSITAAFKKGAPEKILYTSLFGTSAYNSFVEKLAAANPSFISSAAFHLAEGMDTLFNNPQDFYFDASYFSYYPYPPSTAKKKKNRKLEDELIAFVGNITKLHIDIFKGLYPIKYYSLFNANKTYFDNVISYIQANPSYRTWLGQTISADMNMAAMQYNLSGIQEGFDIYELGRLSYFANYKWDTGFSKYMGYNNYRNYPKSGTVPFDNSVIPIGPYVFVNQTQANTSLLTANATNKNTGAKIDLKFYPRTSSLYKAMRLHNLAQWLNVWPYNPYRYTVSTLKYNLSRIPSYNNLPSSYGDLFGLKYTKRGLTTHLAFNKQGVASSSFVDLSGGGPYYIRNVGSGRYMAREGYPNVSTINQVNNGYKKYKLNRNSDGSYYLQPFNNFGNYIGAVDGNSNIKNTTSPTKVFVENLQDGSIKIKLADGRVLRENSENKYLQIGAAAGKFYDYERFTLEMAWDGPPVDLNKTFRIKGLGSGRYLYDGTATTGRAISMEWEDKGAQAQFKLRRRAGGYYDITTTNGNRIHGELVNGRWMYTTTASNLDDDKFLFKLELISGSTYHIKNKASGEYLYENAVDNGDGLHWRILGSGEPLNDNHAKFVLGDKDTYSQSLNGEYYFRNQSSGRHIYINESTSVAEGTSFKKTDDGIRFVLEKQQNGSYKIKSKLSGQYLHTASSNTYSTAPVTGLAEANYQFDLIQASGNLFQIKCRANNQYLFERFDFATGPSHQKIVSYGSLGDPAYSYFYLESTYQAPPENISGQYLIQAKNSGRFVHSGNWLTTKTQDDNDQLRFTLKRHASGAYEIWDKATGQRIHLISDGHFANSFQFGVFIDNYLFFFDKQNDDSYTIKCKANNQYLYEFFSINYSTTQQFIKSDPNLKPGDSYFNLRYSYVPPPEDLSGKYFIRPVNANQESLREIRGANNYVSFSAQSADKFWLRPRLEGQVYEIWNESTGQKLSRYPTIPVSVRYPVYRWPSGYTWVWSSGVSTFLNQLGGNEGLYKSTASLQNESDFFFKIEKDDALNAHSIMNVRRARYLTRKLSGGYKVLRDSPVKEANSFFILEKTY